ncbi:hypothetical protein M378DRAFT_160323 [Amanita muscaria Koide BX008]|uniref:Histone deacetylase domain-containing protein n=1 Tax=Amanita muscaria (strain Koide BX008) TaxID=946122 RepID=A0A0C2XBS9_AMAMK|nr:hypothetical protein M378DRAFT_160323 [Amanita muscaria Koide BX008]
MSQITNQSYRTGVFIQDACYLHQFIRSRATSHIVERPERLRAVMIGVSASIARLEEALTPSTPSISPTLSASILSGGTTSEQASTETEDIEAAMGRMALTQQQQTPTVDINPNIPATIVHSQAIVDLLNHPAVKFIHGDVDGDVYIQNLIRWAQESADKVEKGESEIPPGLSQGDLYLCPQSLDAIQGALGAACEAVDRVMMSKNSSDSPMDQLHRAFVAIRPPGHHCGEDTPSGFCFVNNVAVAAAHAHLQHGVQRIVILDIDLHHGNGTQSIVWQANEETYRQTLEGNPKLGPQIFYGSIHDVLSYPCEDGKPELVQAASVSIHEAHGQYIENIHLEPYSSEEHFWDVLYKGKYSRLLQKAEEFLVATGGSGDDVLFFISCGMDACEHEYESMSRHGRKVPVGFYYQFTRDACALSNKYAGGRIISVLEGGYSDRALISGTMAHISALVTAHNHPIDDTVDRNWWNVDNLTLLEKATKQRKGPGGRKSLGNTDTSERWMKRTTAILSTVDTSRPTRPPASRRSSAPISSTSTRALRDRNKITIPVSSSTSRIDPTKSKERIKQKDVKKPSSLSSESTASAGEESENNQHTTHTKKLPRVVLRLGAAP